MIKDGKFRVRTEIFPVVPFQLKTGALMQEGEYPGIFMSKEFILAHEESFEKFRELIDKKEKENDNNSHQNLNYVDNFVKMFRVRNTIYSLLLNAFDNFKEQNLEKPVLEISKKYCKEVQRIPLNGAIIKNSKGDNNLLSGYVACGLIEGVFLKGDFIYSVLENNLAVEEEMNIKKRDRFDSLLRTCIVE